MPLPQKGNYDPYQPIFKKKPPRNITTLTKSRTKLYKNMAVAGYNHPVGPKPVDTTSKL